MGKFTKRNGEFDAVAYWFNECEKEAAALTELMGDGCALTIERAGRAGVTATISVFGKVSPPVFARLGAEAAYHVIHAMTLAARLATCEAAKIASRGRAA